jgi:hypothetical protein
MFSPSIQPKDLGSNTTSRPATYLPPVTSALAARTAPPPTAAPTASTGLQFNTAMVQTAYANTLPVKSFFGNANKTRFAESSSVYDEPTEADSALPDKMTLFNSKGQTSQQRNPQENLFQFKELSFLA